MLRSQCPSPVMRLKRRANEVTAEVEVKQEE
jgi:TusA-related sulfurtransferase